MKKPDDGILKIKKQWLSDLRTQYLSAIRRAAMSEEENTEYWQNRGEARCILDKVFTLFGFDAAEGLLEDGFKGWSQIRTRGLTLAAVLSLLQPHENVFILHRISPHELEAIGGGTMSTCKGCGAEIDWIRTNEGRYMPVEPEPVFIVEGNGFGRYVTDEGEVITGRRALLSEQNTLCKVAFVPHWKNCPEAKRFWSK